MKSIQWAAIAAMAVTVAAGAEDCGKLVSYGTIPLVQIEGRPAAFIPVEIGGVKKLMMIDTGSEFSTITSAVAKELNLKANPTEYRLFDTTGAKQTDAVITSIKIASIGGDKVKFMLAPAGMDFQDPKIAGVLGVDVLKSFDISLDFGAGTFTLFDQHHCDGQVVYWPERPIAIIPFALHRGLGVVQALYWPWSPVSPDPLRLPKGNVIVFPVTLDGKALKAELDTGASVSTLDKDRAEHQFAIATGSADTPVATGANAKPGLTTWTHRFKSLSLAGIEVNNLEMQIIPDMISQKANNWSTGTALDRKQNSINDEPPVHIGMNVLKHLHLYIAYKEKKLYITPGGTPAATGK